MECPIERRMDRMEKIVVGNGAPGLVGQMLLINDYIAAQKLLAHELREERARMRLMLTSVLVTTAIGAGAAIWSLLLRIAPGVMANL